MNWLEQLCHDYNVTRYQLSKATGISQSYLSKIVKDNISFEDIKVSQYLSIVDFFCIRHKTASFIQPAYEFKKMYSILSDFEDLRTKHLSNEITYEQFSKESVLYLAGLCDSVDSLLSQNDVAGIYVCKKTSYLNAIKNS